MADRIITIDALDIISGEHIRIVYNADTKTLSLETLTVYTEGSAGEEKKDAFKVYVVSDE